MYVTDKIQTDKLEVLLKSLLLRGVYIQKCGPAVLGKMSLERAYHRMVSRSMLPHLSPNVVHIFVPHAGIHLQASASPRF